MQYVKLDLGGRAYTYAWEGPEPLVVGDVVLCPGNSVHEYPFEAKVLRLLDGPDYDGEITKILGYGLL